MATAKADVKADTPAKMEGGPFIVTNTTKAACVLGGFVIKPGENRFSQEDFRKLREARGYERRVEVGVLKDQVNRPPSAAIVVAQIGMADTLSALDEFRDDERLPVVQALKSVEHILSSVTPPILTRYSAEDCLAVLNGRLPKGHPMANPSQRGVKTTPGDPHPAVARACRKRLAQLGVAAPKAA